MDGILKRLSSTDPMAASALRIIEFFDRTMASGPTESALLRATAGLIGSPVGLRRPNGDVRRSSSPDAADGPDARAVTSTAVVPGGGEVWVERRGGDDAFDPLVLERLALSVSLLWETPSSNSQRRDDAESLVSEADEDRRREAARRLGLSTSRTYRLAAVTGTGDRHEVAQAFAAAGAVPTVTVVLDRCVMVVLDDRDGLLTALRSAMTDRTSVRIGLSGAARIASADRMWRDASAALRLVGTVAVPDAVASAEDLGALLVLADSDIARLRDDVSVRRLAVYAATRNGVGDVAVLREFLGAGSLRAAAERSHLHHSSVAGSLMRLGRATGLSLQTPLDRLAAMSTLLAFELVEHSEVMTDRRVDAADPASSATP